MLMSSILCKNRIFWLQNLKTLMGDALTTYCRGTKNVTEQMRITVINE